jgi:hypothetical protein
MSATDRKDPVINGTMRLSVVIAAYNKERTVAVAVNRVGAVPLDMEIIAVNDASTDGTGRSWTVCARRASWT